MLVPLKSSKIRHQRSVQWLGLIDKESAMPCRPAHPSFRSPPALWQMIHLKISSSHQCRIAGNVAFWRQAKTAQNCLHLLTQIGNAFEDASPCSFPLLAISEAKAETLLRINSTCVWCVRNKQNLRVSAVSIACTSWYILYVRRKFRSQTSDSMERWNQSRAESERRERLEERRVEEKESQERRCRCAKR